MLTGGTVFIPHSLETPVHKVLEEFGGGKQTVFISRRFRSVWVKFLSRLCQMFSTIFFLMKSVLHSHSDRQIGF